MMRGALFVAMAVGAAALRCGGNLGCRAYGDVEATCAGDCACATGTGPLCHTGEAGKLAAMSVVFPLPPGANCSNFFSSTSPAKAAADLQAAAAEQQPPVTGANLTFDCSGLAMVLKADMSAAQTVNLTDAVVARWRTSIDPVLAGVRRDGAVVSVGDCPINRPEVAAVRRNNERCAVTVCEQGYRVANPAPYFVAVCLPMTLAPTPSVADDDDEMAASKLAGILLASIIGFILLIGVLIYCVVTRQSAPSTTQKEAPEVGN